MAALARVVLNKAALCGLKVAVWDADASAFVDGVIEDFSAPAGCYIVVGAARRFAVAFHQFTLTEEGEELVLKVTRATPAPLPAGCSGDPDTGPELAAGPGGGSAPRSARASAEELAELVGARFAADESGSCFQAVSPPPAARGGGGDAQQRREEAQQSLEKLGIAAQPGDSDNEDGGGGGGDGSYWGTPVKGGTPRGGLEAQGGGGTAPAAAAPRAVGGSLGAALMRRIANFEEISRLISGGGSGQQQPPTQQQAAAPQPQALPAVGVDDAGDGGSHLPIAAAVSEAGSGTLLPESSSDFAIGMIVDGDAPDVGPRPPSGRSSWRASRSAIDQELAAEEAMVNGDAQLPPGSRRASRVSARNLGASDGERPMSAGGAGAAAGPQAASAQQPPLPGSRRVSRTATRATGELSAAGAGNGGGLSGGGRAHSEPYIPAGPLPAPTPGSRRASRTLSGRLPIDQEPPSPAMMAVLDEADSQDVPPRAPAVAVTVPSRRASHTTPSGRGTPDSDGFGYSGFEEDAPEPILGPEQAQELQRRSSLRLLEALAEGAPPLAAAGLEENNAGAAPGAAATPPRRVSRTVSGLLQAAAAAAEILRGAARGSSAGGGSAPSAAAATMEEPVFGGSALGGPAVARRGVADSFAIASVDSFTCPPMIPFGSPGASSGAGSGGSLTFPSPPRADGRASHQQPSPLSQQWPGVGEAPMRRRPEPGALGGGAGSDSGAGSASSKLGGSSRFKAAPFVADESTAASAAARKGADGPSQIGTCVDGTDAAVIFSTAAGRAAALTAQGLDGAQDAAAHAIQAQQRCASPDAAAAAELALAAVRAPAEVPQAEATPGIELPGLVRRSASGRLAVGERRQQQEEPGQGQQQWQEQGGGSLGFGGVPTRYSEIETAPLVGGADGGPSNKWPSGQPQAARPHAVAAAALRAVVLNTQQHFHGAAFALQSAQVGAAVTPPGTPPGAQLVAALALLAAGHVLRPAGALLWPAVARRHGRRAAAFWLLALSVFPAALIGALPTFAQAGVVSPALMAALSCVQGLALGSEAGPAAIPPRAVGGTYLWASLGPAGAALGGFLAAAACAALAAALPAAALALWGWRVPLVGGPLTLGVMCAALQLAAPEGDLAAPAGGGADCDRPWLRPALRWRVVLGVAALDALPAATLWLVGVSLPALRVASTDAAPRDALGGGVVANLLLLVGLALLGGWLADASGPVPVLLVSGAMAAATAYPAMLLSTSDAPGAAWLGQLLLLAAGGAFAGASAGWPQAEAVPPQARAASLRVAHALGAGIAGGASPLVATALAQSRGAAAGGPAAVVTAASCLSMAACCGLWHWQRRSSV